MICRALVPSVLAVLAAGDLECDAKIDADEVAMLQSRVSRHQQREELARYTVCPGSGNQCNGEQCCDGFDGSNGKTFPCPNAPDGWNGCETSFPDHSSGSCCYSDGCTSCNPLGHYCDTESTCGGDCKGNWCPHAALMETQSNTSK